MEKLLKDYRFQETKYPSEGVELKMTIDRIDGEDLDTSVNLSGNFSVCGQDRHQFAEKLGALIDEYRI